MISMSYARLPVMAPPAPGNAGTAASGLTPVGQPATPVVRTSGDAATIGDQISRLLSQVDAALTSGAAADPPSGEAAKEQDRARDSLATMMRRRDDLSGLLGRAIAARNAALQQPAMQDEAEQMTRTVVKLHDAIQELEGKIGAATRTIPSGPALSLAI